MKLYREDSDLEIEQALLQGRAHETCGGRSLNDDAVDVNLTFVVAGGPARTSATVSTRRPCERPTPSLTWRRRTSTPPRPAVSSFPPSSPTSSPSWKLRSVPRPAEPAAPAVMAVMADAGPVTTTGIIAVGNLEARIHGQAAREMADGSPSPSAPNWSS